MPWGKGFPCAEFGDCPGKVFVLLRFLKAVQLCQLISVHISRKFTPLWQLQTLPLPKARGNTPWSSAQETKSWSQLWWFLRSRIHFNWEKREIITQTSESYRNDSYFNNPQMKGAPGVGGRNGAMGKYLLKSFHRAGPPKGFTRPREWSCL